MSFPNLVKFALPVLLFFTLKIYAWYCTTSVRRLLNTGDLEKISLRYVVQCEIALSMKQTYIRHIDKCRA